MSAYLYTQFLRVSCVIAFVIGLLLYNEKPDFQSLNRIIPTRWESPRQQHRGNIRQPSRKQKIVCSLWQRTSYDAYIRTSYTRKVCQI